MRLLGLICLRYAFTEIIILVNLHSFQKSLGGRSNFKQLQNNKFEMTFHETNYFKIKL